MGRGGTVGLGLVQVSLHITMMLMAAGYTPLHMAVGYSRTATVQVLLDFGADPEVADKEGRNVVELVEKLRAAMPLTPELLGRRTMLENVAGVLTGGLHKTPHGIHYKDDCPIVAEQDRNQATAKHVPVLDMSAALHAV